MLAGAKHRAVGLFGARQEVPGVRFARALDVAAHRQLLQRKLAHRFQHAEAQLAVRLLLPLQEALIHQRRHLLHDV